MEDSIKSLAYNGRYLMMGFASDKTVADEKSIVPRRIALGNFKLCGVMLSYADAERQAMMKGLLGWNLPVDLTRVPVGRLTPGDAGGSNSTTGSRRWAKRRSVRMSTRPVSRMSDRVGERGGGVPAERRRHVERPVAVQRRRRARGRGASRARRRVRTARTTGS